MMSPRAPRASPSPLLRPAPSVRPKGRRIGGVASPAGQRWMVESVVVWTTWLVLFLVYAQLRGYADWRDPIDGGALERSVIGSNPGVSLQTWAATSWPPLAMVERVLHLTWFFAPVVFGFVVMVRERGE